MRRINAFMATLALAGLAISIPGAALASGTAQASGSGAGRSASLCRVPVKRDAAPGVFDVVRFERANGRCICRVSTGPSSQGGSAESALAALLLRRTCADAPLGAAGAAGISTGLIVGGVVLAGGAAALAASGSSSP